MGKGSTLQEALGELDQTDMEYIMRALIVVSTEQGWGDEAGAVLQSIVDAGDEDEWEDEEGGADRRDGMGVEEVEWEDE